MVLKVIWRVEPVYLDGTLFKFTVVRLNHIKYIL
jgi:hypothetical protein